MKQAAPSGSEPGLQFLTVVLSVLHVLDRRHGGAEAAEAVPPAAGSIQRGS